ncbi:hypothetical protein NP493_48g02017 [Ridgeia piscesae]|uniref:Uncharacterized protein n=1 Tax=Ridgeia piscesae TaxID=27915 RepID=A0AAD9UJJ4_RIDPI|nr:hypothetical protein NP493_48g02017 [Ridgeia piscesae]
MIPRGIGGAQGLNAFAVTFHGMTAYWFLPFDPIVMMNLIIFFISLLAGLSAFIAAGALKKSARTLVYCSIVVYVEHIGISIWAIVVCREALRATESSGGETRDTLAENSGGTPDRAAQQSKYPMQRLSQQTGQDNGPGARTSGVVNLSATSEYVSLLQNKAAMLAHSRCRGRRGKVAIKQVAGEEVVMRKDFLESNSTFPGDLKIPLGRSEQFRGENVLDIVLSSQKEFVDNVKI